ncbi:glycosyltransferase family 2 protein, partial [Streptomyces sp. 8N616]|uniref:glycosyltransferase family 2 protein n=1 Tax=Streptomyces sp. 8N616 TaxID=3457414 RepID=UPI003FD50A37
MGTTETTGNPAPAPEVSVVVIVYNDAARLPTAVRSALGQTLRSVEVLIVDDCSTDGSYEVARELAADHPGRVRVFRLDRNSGGCGEPHTRGTGEARGR